MSGRPPSLVKRDVYLRVRLTEAEAKELDRRRGKHSRSNFVRRTLFPREGKN